MPNHHLIHLLLFLAASNALPFNTLVRRFRASIASGVKLHAHGWNSQSCATLIRRRSRCSPAG